MCPDVSTQLLPPWLAGAAGGAGAGSLDGTRALEPEVPFALLGDTEGS